jgi:hypothetical protein
MRDSVLQGFLESAEVEAARANAESDCMRLTRDPASGDPPRAYHGIFKNIPHYERAGDGLCRLVRRPIPWRIQFEDDFCRSLDENLQFRVVSTSREIFHPNIRGGVVCLGPKFRPATRLRSVLEQWHGIASGRVAATDHPFDQEAADYFLAHRDEVRALECPPLWWRPVASRVRVEEMS